MYVFTYVLWKETKISPRHGRNCAARKGIEKNPLAGERQDHTHTGQLQGKEVNKVILLRPRIWGSFRWKLDHQDCSRIDLSWNPLNFCSISG